jgi:proton-coupled amino acid transporter
VPVYDSLSARGQATFSWVLSATLAGVACVYLVVGMVPYLYLVGAAHVAVGDAVTLSLPGTWWAYGIMGAYCVALALTYPLMLFPVLRIAERAAARPLGLRAGSAAARTWKRNGVRAAVVAATLAVAYLGAPQLDNLVALVGCFACTPLAFIFPAWFHMRLAPRTLFTDATNGAIIVLGVGVFCFSTYEAIAGWAVVAVNPCRGA